MAIKQHCDICDKVIPGTEGYRTIHFGRGYNTDVNTGYDPLVVCKDCWLSMLQYKGREDLYRGIDVTTPHKPKPVGNVKEVLEAVVSQESLEKRCKTCKNIDDWDDDNVCQSCVGFDKWEAKNNG